MNYKSFKSSVLWKRLNTETPQHGNGPKREFGSVSFFFQELSEIPQKLKSVEGFPNILGRFPLYLHLIRFPFFWVRFLFFLGQFPVFRKSLNLYFVDQFPFFFESISSFFGSNSGVALLLGKR